MSMHEEESTCAPGPIRLTIQKEDSRRERPAGPLFVYDGDCGFCVYWVNYWKSLTENRVLYAPFQEVAHHFPRISLDEFMASSQFIEKDGRVSNGAKGVFNLLVLGGKKRLPLFLYEKLPGFAFICERAYRFIAGHREFFYRVSRFLWGREPRCSGYVLARFLFLRLLGFVYFIAFISFWLQMEGLIGKGGILPAKAFLDAAGQQFGPGRFLLFPTLAWLNTSDALLHLLAGGGALASLLLVFGVVPRFVLITLWAFYLSLLTVGQDFMSFQWDILLLEAGFLSIFLVPLTLPISDSGSSKEDRRRSPPPLLVGLFWWLLFRLMFLSGALKLLSQDQAWRNLSALSFHYETQPLPNLISWYVHQLPSWFHETSTLAMFLIELAIPFFIFAPRQMRFFAGLSIITFQTLIFFTGNYTFFNILTIGLAFFLFDDAFFARILPTSLQKRFSESSPPLLKAQVNTLGLKVLATLVLLISAIQLTGILFVRLPEPAKALLSLAAPFRIVNTYGLFALMTRPRYEIVIEGSRDGKTWLEYEFKHKPGDLKRAPGFVAPYQPRLDWQMWFAALGSYQQYPWFINFATRLLQGSPEVSSLLGKNPFGALPPRFIRARLYEYHFTNLLTKNATGNWWRRELKREYLPAAALTSN